MIPAALQFAAGSPKRWRHVHTVELQSGYLALLDDAGAACYIFAQFKHGRSQLERGKNA